MAKLLKDMTPEEREAKREYRRKYYAANRDAIIAKVASHYRANQEQRKEYARQHYAANRESHRAAGAEYRLAHAARRRDQQAAYRAANREKILARMRMRYAANRSAVLARARETRKAYRGTASARQKRRLSDDVQFRLATRLRQRLGVAVARSTRSGSAVRDLGMPIAEFKARLESQFLPGMTWENWGSGPGSWQIDHVYPLAAADLTDRAQLLAACNYRNLQPLWFADNLAKSDSVSPEAQALFDELVSLFRGGAR
jgi:hypothetical protein